MKEIAEKLAQALVEAQELKDFLSSICCESYGDIELFHKERSMLEASFPTYSEATECQGKPIWGEQKLGRLPSFLYDDSRSSDIGVSRLAQTLDGSPVMSHVEDWTDASRHKELFTKAFQYFQSRCQHHIHKLVDGKRVVPNACRSKRKPTECKHEAPWTNRVSPDWMKQPLLVCKGIAKKLQPRCSGARNWLGQSFFT